MLGGREPKYRKLYEDTITAINERLLYRPMLDGDWDVFFTAKLWVGEDGSSTSKYEVTHLTCFVGGMYALGGRLFGRSQDVEMARKLTDGCVWAYQAMPAGVMPEASQVVPCPRLDRCDFNETRWHEALDPEREQREERLAAAGAEVRRKKAAASQSQAGLGEEKSPASQNQAELGEEKSPASQNQAELGEGKSPASQNQAELGEKKSPASQNQAELVKKKSPASQNQADGPSTRDATPGSSGLVKRADLAADTARAAAPADEDEDEDLPQTPRENLGATDGESDADGSTPTILQRMDGGMAMSPAEDDEDEELSSDDLPLSHQEFVQEKIKQTKMPKGFSTIDAPNYILR